MNSRKMSFTFLAVADLRRICEAIAMPTDRLGVTGPANLARAQAFADKFARHCELLARNPELGTDRQELLHGMRSSSFQSYVMFYRSRGEAVEVVRVLRTSRDPGPQA
jgi:plasmid stabilization system protein ParE